MTNTVRERADTVATLRYIAVHLMETVARWVPTTAELEVKILLGRHIWVFAQHADALGRRTAELRLAQHASRPPSESFQRVLDHLDGAESTAGRVDGLYDGMLPILSGLCDTYLRETDPLMDEPSVRILETIVADIERLRAERSRDMAAAPVPPPDERDWVGELRGLADDAPDWVDFRPPVAAGSASA